MSAQYYTTDSACGRLGTRLTQTTPGTTAVASPFPGKVLSYDNWALQCSNLNNHPNSFPSQTGLLRKAPISVRAVLMSVTFQQQVVLSILGCNWTSSKNMKLELFLPREAMLASYMSWPCVYVLSVCFVTSRCSTKKAKCRITQTKPHNSPGTLVFWCQRPNGNSTGITSSRGAKCRWGRLKLANFDK